jgi:preprotein translocase subunit SecE
MAKNSGLISPRRGAGRTPVAAAKTAGGKTPAPTGKTASTTPDAPKRPFNPVAFAREVRAEARKISWTSRQETWITSVMVFIMVLVTAVFFVVVDSLLGHGMQLILKLAA